MRIVRAEAMGMCFGVRDALAVARSLPDPEHTTVHGELVHNEAVLEELERRGFQKVDEARRSDRVTTPRLLITAHGIAERERARLAETGLELIDTTCPLVRLAHAQALELAAEGRHVIVLGRHGHVEVRGLVGDLDDWSVVESEEDVRTWPHRSLGILCQTTLPERVAGELRAAIRRANPQADITFRDTICEPTKARQRAIEELVRVVPAVVVVGGQNSNNTRQLVATCIRAGVAAFHVQGPSDLPFAALSRFSVLGLTAGTSTTEAAIDAVERALRQHSWPRRALRD